VTCKALRHPNVLPFVGVTMTEKLFVMVSEWMGNGDINRFVEANIDADRLELVSFRSRPSYLFVVDDNMTIVAQRHRQGIESFA